MGDFADLKPDILNIEVKFNNSIPFKLEFLENYNELLDTGDAVDISELTPELVILDDNDEEIAVLTYGNGLSAPGSSFEGEVLQDNEMGIFLDNTSSTFLVTDYYYTLTFTSASDEVRTWIKGTLSVTK